MNLKRILTLLAAVAMVALVLLAPIVSLQSYHWTSFEVLGKLQRLVSDGLLRATAIALLAALLLAPVGLIASALGLLRARLWLSLVPAAAALVVTALLLMAEPVSPALGLWLYLALALAMLTGSLTGGRRRPTSR